MTVKRIRWSRSLGLCALLLAGAVCAARAQEEGSGTPFTPSFSGVFETYTLASGTGDDGKASHNVNWLSVSARVSPGARVVGGLMSFRDRYSLDENFLELDGKGGDKWRIGRIRPAFGFSDWSENYYAGFPRMALLRTTGLGSRASNIRLNRLDSGISWRGGSRSVEHQVALVDTQSSKRQVMADRAPSLVTRSQFNLGNWLVGLNLLTATERFERGNMRLVDVDWRWSEPHFQVRGEMLYGKVGSQHPAGYYLDLFHHPGGTPWTRTTFLARTEALNTGAPGAGYAHLYTLGVKQILTKGLTAELTHAWSNANEPARGRRGWALQLITFSHF